MLIENRIGTTKVPPSTRARVATLLAPETVAGLLCISKTTLYRLVARRALRFYRISGVLRFDQRDVEEFITRGRVEPVQNV
jgi:excisionase family DNA binding protein